MYILSEQRFYTRCFILHFVLKNIIHEVLLHIIANSVFHYVVYDIFCTEGDNITDAIEYWREQGDYYNIRTNECQLFKFCEYYTQVHVD